MTAILREIHKERTARGREQLSRAQPGRPRKRVAGGHIADLAALKKAILLTRDEARKFNAEAAGYATPRNSEDFYHVSGFSDASGERCNQNGVLFLPKN